MSRRMNDLLFAGGITRHFLLVLWKTNEQNALLTSRLLQTGNNLLPQKEFSLNMLSTDCEPPFGSLGCYPSHMLHGMLTFTGA